MLFFVCRCLKGTIQRIGEEKKKNAWACEIVSKLVSLEKPYEQDSGAQPQYLTVPDLDHDDTGTVRDELRS